MLVEQYGECHKFPLDQMAQNKVAVYAQKLVAGKREHLCFTEFNEAMQTVIKHWQAVPDAPCMPFEVVAHRLEKYVNDTLEGQRSEQTNHSSRIWLLPDEVECDERPQLVFLLRKVREESHWPWCQAVISNGFFGTGLNTMLGKLCPEVMLALSRQFISGYQTAIADRRLVLASVDSFIIDAFDEMYTFHKGVIVTASDEPWDTNCTLEDFRASFDPQMVHTRQGLRSAMQAANTNPEWQSYIADYLTNSATLEKHGREYQETKDALTATLNSEDELDTSTIGDRIQKWAEAIECFYQELPHPTAVHRLDTLLVNLILHKLKPVLQNITSQQVKINLYRVLVTAVDMVDDQRENAELVAFKSGLNDTLKQHKGAESAEALYKIAANWIGQITELQPIADAVDNCKGFDLEERVLSELDQLVDFICKAVKDATPALRESGWPTAKLLLACSAATTTDA